MIYLLLWLFGRREWILSNSVVSPWVSSIHWVKPFRWLICHVVGDSSRSRWVPISGAPVLAWYYSPHFHALDQCNVALELISWFRRVVRWNHPLCRIDLGWTYFALIGIETTTICMEHLFPSRQSSFHSLCTNIEKPGDMNIYISPTILCVEGIWLFLLFRVWKHSGYIARSQCHKRVLMLSLRAFAVLLGIDWRFPCRNVQGGCSSQWSIIYPKPF